MAQVAAADATGEAVGCPACGGPSARCRGRLAGKGGLITLAQPGFLYDCPVCGLLFRRPFPASGELAAQYQAVPADAWALGPSSRPDFRKVRFEVAQHVDRGRVLDVGCHRGDFLLSLPSHYEKIGTEYSEAARAVASSRGIRIVGQSLDDARAQGLVVDAITMIDVLEHVLEPLRVLEVARELLRPGGVIAVSTGDAGSWLWRRHPLDYWYYFSEHVSFFCERWFRWAGGVLGLDIFASRRFSYFPVTGRTKMLACARTLAFEAGRWSRHRPLVGRVFARLYPVSAAMRWREPPWMAWVRDHFVIVLRMPARLGAKEAMPRFRV